MSRRAWATSLLPGALVLASCARDRATELPERPAPVQPQPAPQPTFPRIPSIALRPAPSATTTASTLPPPPPPASSAAPPPAALPPAALPPDPRPEASDLFRAQDACLSSCDQFACMKIATAYRQGAGVPKDVLAGRRYAIHACLECGKPGPGIVDQCPDWQLSSEPQRPK